MASVGFAVAGGSSRRMGRDKALLPWAGTDLLGHALARLGCVVPEVRILCGSEPRYRDRRVPVDTDSDAFPDAGPLAGLLSGLEAAAGRTALVLAVDLPLVPVQLLRRLVELAEGYDAVVPASPRGPEPLCALYGPACREPIRRHLDAGDYKMTCFWPEIRLRLAEPRELLDRDPPEQVFLNLNSPADYAAARPA